MDQGLRRLVRERARDVCEYCRLPQQAQAWIRFHIEQIVPQQHGGGDGSENLCLSCPHCNRNKGPNLASIDAVTGQLVPLFNPRTQNWLEHFQLVEHRILGKTVEGRVTVALLRMNAPGRVQLRMELAAEGAPEIG